MKIILLKEMGKVRVTSHAGRDVTSHAGRDVTSHAGRELFFTFTALPLPEGAFGLYLI